MESFSSRILHNILSYQESSEMLGERKEKLHINQEGAIFPHMISMLPPHFSFKRFKSEYSSTHIHCPKCGQTTARLWTMPRLTYKQQPDNSPMICEKYGRFPNPSYTCQLECLEPLAQGSELPTNLLVSFSYVNQKCS